MFKIRFSTWFFGALGLCLMGCPAPGGDDETGADTETSSGTLTGGNNASSSGTEPSTGGSDGVSASADSGTESTGGTGNPPAPCPDPVSIDQPGGTPTGFARCDDGRVVRVGPSVCEGPVSPGSCSEPREGGCATDSDCDAGNFGRCDNDIGGIPGLGCSCNYGCETDADCPTGLMCACSGAGVLEGRSQCIPQGCDTAADCGDGQQCVLAWKEKNCTPDYRVACTMPGDTCTYDDDCVGLNGCYPENGVWSCMYKGCE